MPDGLSVNASTGVIYGTLSSTADQNGPYSVTVTVGDGTDSASASFTWYVDLRVTLDAIGNQTNVPGDVVSLTAWGYSAASGSPTLTYSATGLPAGLSINSSTGDNASVAMNTPTTIAVLNNDNGAVSIVSVTDASNGTLALDGNNIVYTPNADFTGPDLIGYTIADSLGHTSSTTVDITVYDPTAPAPTLEADNDSFTTAINTAITMDVLDNDDNYTGGPTITTGPTHGSAVVNPDGTITYTPNTDYNGTDSLQYTIVDADNNTQLASVNITVQPVVVQFDMNDTPELSDDVAFVGTPMKVTVIFHAPGLTNQTVTIQAGDGAKILLDPNDDPDTQGLTEYTYTGLDNGAVRELWLVATRVSAAADDIQLTAFLNNNFANDYGKGTVDGVTVQFWSGWIITAGQAWGWNAQGLIYAHSTPQAMVDAGNYRIAPRAWTLLFVQEDGLQNDKKTIYMKVLGQNALNGKTQFVNDFGGKPIDGAWELKRGDFKETPNTTKRAMHAYIRGWESEDHTQVAQTAPPVNNVSNAKKLIMVIANSSEVSDPDTDKAKIGAKSAGFSVAAIITKVEMKRDPNILYGKPQSVTMEEKGKEVPGIAYNWGRQYEVKYHSDSGVEADLDAVMVTEKLETKIKQGWWKDVVERESSFMQAYRTNWLFWHLIDSDLHTIEYTYSVAFITAFLAKNGKAYDPALFRGEALADAKPDVLANPGRYERVQWFEFYDKRTGMTEQTAVKVGQSGFRIMMRISKGILYVRKVAEANHGVAEGIISQADSSESRVEIK